MAVYEITLAPAAVRSILGMSASDRKTLADALRSELNAESSAGEYRLEAEGRSYTVMPLSFHGYFAVYRAMTPIELKQLEKEQKRVAELGFYVIDIVPTESAFIRSPSSPEIRSEQSDRLSRTVRTDAEESAVRQFNEDELRRILE